MRKNRERERKEGEKLKKKLKALIFSSKLLLITQHNTQQQ
jgi:hypothetical protein